MQGALDALVGISSLWLFPLMITLYITAIACRMLVYYTTKRQEWMAMEFEKRVENFIEDRNPESSISFYVITKRLLERTYYELFRVRYTMKRRKPDFLMTMTDRVFLVKQGTAFFVNDILKPLKHIKFNDNGHPKLLSITKKAFARNPSYSKVLGIIPSSSLNDVVNILPGVFIVLGIFGTFVGIMQGLPDLGSMDLKDADGAKALMDQFLIKMAFSMNTSLVGIVFSLTTQFLNAATAPEKVYVNAVDRFEASLDALWHLSSDNELPNNLTDFNENRHPDEVLAEQAVNEDLILGKKKMKLTRVA